jgi:hypothetical protein
MPFSCMLRRVALAKTKVSEERSASFVRVTRIVELGTTLAVSSNRRTLPRYTMYIISIPFYLQSAPTILRKFCKTYALTCRRVVSNDSL